MSATSEDFKQGMRKLGAAVNIVTTASKNFQAGLTATAVCSLSAEPPRVLACVNNAGITFDTIEKSQNICINVLASDQTEIAMRFAGMMQEEENERFDKNLWQVGKSGAPVLKHSLVSFDCEVESITNSGSHAIIIGKVVDVVNLNDGEMDPLFYMDGKWGTIDFDLNGTEG